MNLPDINIYREIFFAFLYRDEEFPAVIKSKGYNIKGYIQTLYNALKSDIIDFFTGNNKDLSNKIWLYAESINQLRAIEFLTQMHNTVLVTDSGKLVKSFPEKNIHRIVHKDRLFKRLYWVKRRKYYRRLFGKKYKNHLNTIYRYDGIYESLFKIIQVNKPKAIIMSNDHNVANRALLLAGKKNGIATIYLQHAAVTNRFPPLKFDLNLLDGNDSLEKYKEAGLIEGQVELIGMPKFDAFHKFINKKATVQTIGFAINASDNINHYITVADFIKDQFPHLQIIFRYHPAVKESNRVLPDNVQESEPKKETSFDFLKKIDMLLAGNSSIHLEAVLMNVNSFSINFEGDKNDYYGFIKNGMIDIIDFDKSLISAYLKNCIEKKPNVRLKAKYYVETIDTEWDGQSSKLVLDIIGKL